jgi:Flp pilus assembly pilin Flp
MKAKFFTWRYLQAKFVECMRDERGTAMTEYLIVTCIMVPLAAFLFNPDNGFYQDFRNQYNLTTTLLIYPGP